MVSSTPGLTAQLQGQPETQGAQRTGVGQLTALLSSLAGHLQREAPGESQERREPPAGSGGAGPGRGVSRRGKHPPPFLFPLLLISPTHQGPPPSPRHCPLCTLPPGGWATRAPPARGCPAFAGYARHEVVPSISWFVVCLQIHEVLWNLLPGVLSIVFIGEKHVVEVLGRQ